MPCISQSQVLSERKISCDRVKPVGMGITERGSRLGRLGSGTQDSDDYFGSKSGFCRQVMGEKRKQSSVTNIEECKLGASRPGFIPSSATTQGQAKSHALLPFIYLEHKLQSHNYFSVAIRTDLQILSYCKERCQRLASKSSSFFIVVKKMDFFFQGGDNRQDGGDSTGWEALSKLPALLYSY